MLPSTYEPSDYSFFANNGPQWRLAFTSEALSLQAKTQPTEPWWFMEVGDERNLKALIRWVRVRRLQWPAWGKLAESSGRPALAALLNKLLNEDPPAEVMGVVVEMGDDDHELALGELTQGPGGLTQRIYYRHRFSSAALRNAFHDWLLANNPEANGGALIEVALNHGTDQLGEQMDLIAADELNKKAA